MLKKLTGLLDELNLTEEEKEEKLRILQKDIQIPVKIIGIGQTGVGKTELLKSIFKIAEENIESFLKFKGRKEDFDLLETGSVKSVTKEFFSFTIENDEGFRVQFTDGPGLGESGDKEEDHLNMWIKEIPNHDLLYWVLDASSRDMAHIQKNMKYMLDQTNYRNKLIVVLNKIDQILLPLESELRGLIGWDLDLNEPSRALLNLITERTNDIMEKLTKYVEINRDQMVVCSARKRWQHDLVFDRMIECLPDNKRLKVSRNREIKDTTELMTEEGKKRIQNN